MGPWKRCLPRRSLLAALLPLLLPALAGCSSPPGVVVDIGTWPEGATTLRVESTLNGAPARDPLSFASITTRFVLYLPEGASGELGLKLSAHDADECLRASGEARIEVGGSRLRPITEASAPLSAVSPRSCPGPGLDGIDPVLASTAGGTPLEVTGQRFLQGARLSIDGAAAADVSVLSPTRLRATVPRRLGAFGLVPVIVSNPDGQSAMRGDLFSYYASQVAFSGMASIDTGPSTNPTAVKVADVNGDSNPDLVSTDGADAVRVFLGDGKGAFGAPQRFPVGPNSASLVVGDWNGDKNADVAAITFGNNSVALLLGDGKGGFGSIPSLAGINGPTRIAQGDLNGA